MRDVLVILRRNFISPIVIAIFSLAAVLIILRDYTDGWFLTVVISVNIMIGVVQELRARFALRKLELLSAPHAKKILPDGKIMSVMYGELRVGDIIELVLGDEVPADGQILQSNGLEINESILTGESRSVGKANGDKLCSASAVTAGSGQMKILAVGHDTEVGKMSAKLKRYRPRLTPLQKTIAQAISWLTYGALFLAALIFVVYYLSGQDAIQIFKTITAAAVAVVPEGLLLASSLLLAYGSLRLAEAKVLPQKLSAIEAMALLDVLCVDKTGTLTSNVVKYEKSEVFGEPDKNLDELIGIVAKETTSSTTGKALIKAFSIKSDYKVIQTLPFSSSRKYSGIRVKLGGKTYSVLLGAADFLESVTRLTKEQKAVANKYSSEGRRVLMMAIIDDPTADLGAIGPKSAAASALLILSNDFREGVRKSIAYLQRKGVRVCVISGDDPNTVKYVASKAGIVNGDKVITGEDLKGLNQEELDKLVAKYSVYARILPEQKERLVRTFRRLGFYTGMVGDGVNDALALKKSDLGIAMYQGAPATRRVADIVLLDNSFNSLPVGMHVGNQIIQAIELIATLFFNKIIFGVVILFITLAAGVIYPFEPRHLTFMNIFLTTMPTVMWTLFPPSPRHRLNPRSFWQDTLLGVLPVSILSGLAVAVSYLWLMMEYPHSLHGVITLTVVIATFFGVYLVYLVPRMFDVSSNQRSRMARLIYTIAIFVSIIPSFGLRITREFFSFSVPSHFNNWQLILIIVGVAVVQWYIATAAGRRLVARTDDRTLAH